MLKYSGLFVLLLLLVACGGSNSSTSNPSSHISTSSFSSAVSSQSSNTSNPAAPTIVSATAGPGAVTLRWNSVGDAAEYHVYMASEPGIIPANIAAFDEGRKVSNVTSPYTVSGLQNGKAWFFVVTASNAAGESGASSEAQATPSGLDASLQPTPQEVLVLELINRARANPQAEADRHSIGLNDGISGAAITNDAKPPLALNTRLQNAARLHSQWMLDNNIFSHTGVNNSSVTERATAAGYALTGSWTVGENIAVAGGSANTINLTLMAEQQHQNLFQSPGHRVNLLNSAFREAGIGQQQGYYTFSNGGNYLSSMLTEVFARSGTSYFLTGVAYQDNNNNNFYDVGEGLANITIEINDQYYEVFSSGAYSIPLGNGTYTMTVHGPGTDLPVQHTFTINNGNLKRDIVRSGNIVSVN